MKHFLISRNADGSITYLAQGSKKQMEFLCRFSFHAVTTIDDFQIASKCYGIKRIIQKEYDVIRK